MTQADSALTLIGATRRRGRARDAFELGPIDLDVRRGEWIAIAGRSGAGKTTLLHLCAGLDRPDSGALWIRGRDVTSASESLLARMRRDHVGVVLQESAFVEHLTLAQNLALRLIPLGVSAGARRRRAEEALATFGLANLCDRAPNTLSGGERRRAAVARALLGEPEILIADEPTSDVDDATAAAIAERFESLRARGATLVISTHDAVLAARASRTLTLERGRVQP